MEVNSFGVISFNFSISRREPESFLGNTRPTHSYAEAKLSPEMYLHALYYRDRFPACNCFCTDSSIIFLIAAFPVDV